MMGLALSGIAFVVSLALGRHSLGAGVGAALSFGYLYGILRAQFYDAFAYFIFDAAVLGLYAARFTQPQAFQMRPDTRGVYLWTAALIGWPLIIFGLFAIFPQHVLIQLVGLRSAVWFLPFLLLGASLSATDLTIVARTLAVLNFVALGFGLGEYLIGLEPFYPPSPITELIYRSNDVAGYTAFRIPATFSTSAGYGGTMVASVPFLAGLWLGNSVSRLDRLLALMGLIAAALGTFLCASRMPVVTFFILSGLLVIHLRRRLGYLVLAGLACVAVAYVISGEERLQRFSTLQDPELLAERVTGSVNLGVLDVLVEYPIGAGLGSAWGTNIPTILIHLASSNPIGAENEYARIGVEQGLAGLLLWCGFLFWSLMRRATSSNAPIGNALMYAFVAISWGTALLGAGTLNAVPGAALLLLQMGILGRRSARLQLNPHSDSRLSLSRARQLTGHTTTSP